MSALGRFEQWMESIVEGSARRLFRSRITAAEITRRLERAMESHQSITVDRIIVPSVYHAYLNPEDFKSFESIHRELEKEMGIYLLELAQERGFTLLQHPVVAVVPDQSTDRHTVRIEVEMVAPAQSRSPQGVAHAATQVMASRDGQRAAQPHVRTELFVRLPEGERRLALTGALISIGRGLSNDLVLDDPRVSRHHAQIWGQSQRFAIADQGSTNGTYVNGVPVSSEHPLHPGDVISLGGLELEFHQR